MVKYKHKKLPFTLEVYSAHVIVQYKHQLQPGLITRIRYKSKREALDRFNLTWPDFKEVKPRG